MGAEAVRKLLCALDLVQLSDELRTELGETNAKQKKGKDHKGEPLKGELDEVGKGTKLGHTFSPLEELLSKFLPTNASLSFFVPIPCGIMLRI